MRNVYKRLNLRRREGGGPSRGSWVRWLRWQQWLVLFAMGGLMIVIEVHDHSRMWHDHQSGQTFWTDPELIREVLLAGLIFPVLGGAALGRVGRAAQARDEMARQLEMRRQLAHQMHEARSWQELADLLVTIPGATGPADEVWLLARWATDEGYDLAAHWKRPGSFPAPPGRPVVPAMCEQCDVSQRAQSATMSTCSQPVAGNGEAGNFRHCIWLSVNGAGKVALLWDSPHGSIDFERQRQIMNDLADEMSLACENARLHYVDQTKGEAAMKERLRIARDLHDTLGQNVTFLRLKLEHLFAEASAVGHAEFKRDFARILQVADEAYDQVRDTLEELRTAEIPDLEESLRLYGSQASERAGFDFRVHCNGETRPLSARQSRQILYIAREAVNNIEKHAAARQVELALGWRETELQLSLRDDGLGFRLEDAGQNGAYGIAIMRERSLAIRGDLAIASAPGKGTEVTLRVPLAVGAGTGNGER